VLLSFLLRTPRAQQAFQRVESPEVDLPGPLLRLSVEAAREDGGTAP
jgi:hypothetical protein